MQNFDQAPFLVIWEVTQACDLACAHCRSSAVPFRDPRELTTKQGLRLLEAVKSFGDPLMVFTGGDPLKRPDLYSLLRKSVSLGLRTTVTPSATPLLTAEAIEIYPSGFLPIAAGNVQRDSLVEVYRHSPLFVELRDSDNLKGKCRECEYRNLCGGSRSRAFALTGDYLAEEQRCVYLPVKTWALSV